MNSIALLRHGGRLPAASGTRTLLVVLAAASVFSVAGTFLLVYYPGVAGMFGRSLQWLMRVPTFLYMLLLPAIVFVWSVTRFGWRRSVVLLVWASGVGLAAELAGTTTGMPFGVYAYTDFLGYKILGHVPALVPLSWYAMAVLAIILAAAISDTAWGRVVLTATFMVCWDLALDPAMVAGWPVWVWSDPAGVFYGMPLANLTGWWLTSAVIAIGFTRLVDFPRGDHRWASWVWLVSAILPLGLSLVRQLWPAVLVGVLGVALPVVLVWYVRHRSARAVAVPVAG